MQKLTKKELDMKNPRDKIILITLFVVILFAFFATVIFSESHLSLSARSAVLYSPDTNEFLYSENADARLPMASTTKIMTALVALENSDITRVVEIADEAIGVEGSSLYLKRGEAMTMEDLLYGLMLRSANDAALAIAYEISGGVYEFAELMNSKASELGLTDTHFENPHGLDSPLHYTTAKELAVIASAALKNETFKKIVSTKKTTITNEDGEARLIINHNKLLRLYDGAIGVKTGFTKKSGRSLVGAVEKDGLSFITVTINAPDDWNDHKKLFDYGYSLLKSVTLADAREFTYNIPVIGSDKDLVTVSNTDALSVITKHTDSTPDYDVILPQYISAPVKAGDVIGKVIFTLDGKNVGELPLIAEEDAVKVKNKRFTIF